MPSKSRPFTFASGMFAAGLATAAAWAEDDALYRLPPPAIQFVYPGGAIEKALAEALSPIRTYDLDGDGLDAADVDTAEAIALARQRSPILAHYLAFDLDGDLKVTDREIRMAMHGDFHGRSDSEVAQMVAQIMVVDRNHDDVISIEEIKAIAALDWRDQYTFRQLRQIMAADPNGDGRVTLAELEGLVRAAFGGVDTNGNGVIEAAEYAAKETEILRAHVAAFNPDCRLPQAGEGEELVRALISEGLAQPTVTVSGQDRETSLVRVNIEPGDRPLYLLLSPRNAILKFQGARARLKHVVVMTVPPSGADDAEDWSGAGILGISRDLITFLPAAACAMQSDVITQESMDRENRMIAAAIGAKAPTVIGGYSTEGISLPSGQVINPQRDTDVMVTAGGSFVVKEGEAPKELEGGFTPEFQEQWLAKPGGIVALDPNDVISSGKVETYEVLPGQEGLTRLVQTGFLARTPDGYRLLKPIPRWPAGLNGAHGVKVFVPEGMPRPKDQSGVLVVTDP